MSIKAHSTDLRQKIIETYEHERISQRQLAQRFRVALSFIVKLLKQYRETGDLRPKTSPRRPRELNETQLAAVQALVETNPDWTLYQFSKIKLQIKKLEPYQGLVFANPKS